MVGGPVRQDRQEREESMSFRGRDVPDALTCANHNASHLNICKTPWWTLLIREFTLWECPKCSRVYRLEWQAAGADAAKFWERYKGEAA